MRLIDADKLKRKAQKVGTEAWLMKQNAPIETTLNQFIDWIENAPTIEQSTWIPCSERLPSVKDYVSDMVIWCTDKSIVGVGWYYERTKSWGTVDDTFLPVVGEVFAWMPLPEPMKGAENE